MSLNVTQVSDTWNKPTLKTVAWANFVTVNVKKKVCRLDLFYSG